MTHHANTASGGKEQSTDSPFRIGWDALASRGTTRAEGAAVTIEGFPVAAPGQLRADRFMLVREQPCCPGCAPRAAGGSISVDTCMPVPVAQGAIRLTGRWIAEGGCYRLLDARLAEPAGWRGITRRRALMAGPLMCLPAAKPASAAAVLGATTPVDLHSHAGGIANVARMRSGQAFAPVAEPMRKGGMAAACLAVVSDGPTHKLMPDRRLRPFRDPEPGELYQYAQLAFGRLHGMLRVQGLRIVTSAAGLRGEGPGAIVSAEGADFLEGQVDRVDEAYAKWSLRHLQLTHYRVNELGDIQTEPPVHGGLTDFGAEVIRRCNRLGIVVDVAHGTFDLVKRAASVTTKPLVLSHTSLADRSVLFSRQILPEHARLVASTGGVIGIWPPESRFPTLDALAVGMARMVDVAGIDHVGLGSDMRGLTGPSVFPDYDRAPALADALLGAGFSTADAAKIMGGNYARVFQACVGPG